MSERKALSARTRFEVFKRDGFRCVYCGITALNAVLHCDHVVAVADGGPDTTDNLATSCRDCNLGKSAVPLEQRKLRDNFTDDAEREHADQIREYLKIQRDITDAKREAEAMVLERWQELMGEWHWTLPRYLSQPIKELGLPTVIEAVEIVARKGITGNASVRYFCGILRKRREKAPANEVPSSEDIKLAGYWDGVMQVIDAYWYGRIPFKQPLNFRRLVIDAIHGGGPLEIEDIFNLIDVTLWGDNYPRDYSFSEDMCAAWFVEALAEVSADRESFAGPHGYEHRCKLRGSWITPAEDCQTKATAISIYWTHRLGSSPDREVAQAQFKAITDTCADFFAECDPYEWFFKMIDKMATQPRLPFEQEHREFRLTIALDVFKNTDAVKRSYRKGVADWPELEEIAMAFKARQAASNV